MATPTAASLDVQAPVVKPRISVLHLIHTIAYGGVETAVLNWLQHIDRSRFEVHLACFANPGETEAPFVEAATRRGFEVHKLSWGRRKPLWRASSELMTLMARYHVDVLHTHNCYADCVGALAARRRPVKTVTTLYVWSPLGWKRNLIQQVNRYAIRSFDLITAHCDDTYRKTLALGFPPEKVKTLICGFQAQSVQLSRGERERRREKLGASPEDVVLINVARLYPEKEQAFLLRAFRRLLQNCPQARLWIAGVGPLENDLRNLAAQLGLDPFVRFLGFVNDLPSLLALPDIQVNTSSTEGVPLAICSGMAARLPIVATAVGGLREVIKSGESGILVPPQDEQALLEALTTLIQSPEYRQQLGMRALQFVNHDYSLSRAVRAVEQTYQEVLGSCVLES